MDTTVDVAEAGQNTPVPKSVRAARRAHEARVRFWRAVAVSSLFVIILGANLFIGAVVMLGSMRTKVSSDKIDTNHQIARVRRPLLDGTLCRNIVFDNKTSQTISDKVERCDLTNGKPKVRRKTQFSWGGG